MTREHLGVSFRNHPLRFLQSAFQGLTPEIVEFMCERGWLNGTPVANMPDRRQNLHPDHLTLAGLQITVRAADELVKNGGYRPIGQMLVGFALDGLDGPFARYRNRSSPEGAVKDVLADRIAEIHIAQLIADERSKRGGEIPDLSKLKMAFQLSTLTKAASEIVEVHTSEGGQGSMLERRRVLLVILQKLGKLNSNTNPSESSRSNILSEVDANINLLIKSSEQRAKERIGQIMASGPFVQRGWNNTALDDETSPAAIEARKYATVVLMNQREGLDIVSHLNELAGQEMFPSLESLSQRYLYVGECIKSTEQFLNDALKLIYRG